MNMQFVCKYCHVARREVCKNLYPNTPCCDRQLMSMPLESHMAGPMREPPHGSHHHSRLQQEQELLRSGDWDRRRHPPGSTSLGGPLNHPGLLSGDHPAPRAMGLLSGEYPRIGDAPLNSGHTLGGAPTPGGRRSRLAASTYKCMIGHTDEYVEHPSPLDLRVPHDWVQSRGPFREVAAGGAAVREGLQTQPYAGGGEGYSQQDKLASLKRDAQALMQVWALPSS